MRADTDGVQGLNNLCMSFGSVVSDLVLTASCSSSSQHQLKCSLSIFTYIYVMTSERNESGIKSKMCFFSSLVDLCIKMGTGAIKRE